MNRRLESKTVSKLLVINWWIGEITFLNGLLQDLLHFKSQSCFSPLCLYVWIISPVLLTFCKVKQLQFHLTKPFLQKWITSLIALPAMEQNKYATLMQLLWTTEFVCLLQGVEPNTEHSSSFCKRITLNARRCFYPQSNHSSVISITCISVECRVWTLGGHQAWKD